MRTVVAAACAAIVGLAAAPAAHAESSAEVRVLAERAEAGDSAALAQLRAVREVDGRVANLGSALAGVDGADLLARLRLLAEEGTPSGTMDDPAAAAEEILDDSRFTGSTLPRPFHGVLSWLGDRLREAARPFRWLARRLPGDDSVGAILLAGIVVMGAATVALLIARRRAGVALEHAQRRTLEETGNPDELEREADEAERRGDFEGALRLRFRAGLGRLALAKAIPAGEWTSGELRPIVAQPAFDLLAVELDAVAYGGRSPSRGDVAAARQAWEHVLEHAGTR